MDSDSHRVPEAKVASQENGYSWRLMEDPEGNELCLIYDWK